MAAKKPEKPSAKKTTGAAKAGAAKAGAAKAGAAKSGTAKAGAAKGAGKGTAAAPKKGLPALKKVVAAAKKAVSKPAASKTAAKPVAKTTAKTTAKSAASAKPVPSSKKAAPSAAKATGVVKKAAPVVAERAMPEPRRHLAAQPAAPAAAPRRLRPTKPTKEMYSAATGTNTSDPFPVKELEKFRQLIHDIRAESIEELDMLTEQLREMTAREVGEDNNAYSLHMAEQGTDAMEREKTFLQAQRTSDYVKKLGEALERITNKSFGICRICGLRLDSKRLLAVPVTQVCTVYKNTSKPCEPGRLHMLETGVNEEDVPG